MLEYTIQGGVNLQFIAVHAVNFDCAFDVKVYSEVHSMI